MPPLDLAPAIRIAVALLGGAAVGAERQRSGHASGPDARLGGIRTFTLLGTVAGVAGWLSGNDYPLIAGLLIAGALALVVVGYVRASKFDVDGTTEVAALVVVAAGVLAGLGQLQLAAGLNTLTVLLLVEKPRLHRLVTRLDEATVLAATRFALMSLVILPLLPDGPFGPPPGIRPRELWMLVLLFSGMSFVGFVAQRLAGMAGYPVAGLLGGLVSSTSVTLTFARLSRTHKAQGAALAAGAIAASTVLFLRVGVAVAALDYRLLYPLSFYLVPPLLTGVVALALAWRLVRHSPAPASTMKNPLQFRAALEIAAMFQAVLVGVFLVRSWLGDGGLLATGFVLGLTDVDALTLSMTRSVSSGTPIELACRAIAMGVVGNSLMKLAIAGVIGESRFAWVTGLALAAMALTMATLLLTL